jgi:hypothetical protein
MNYPNVMAPGPQEIYESLKMIPNTPQGKQMLSGLVQQGQQTGSVEGGIAAALLNSYNKVQPAPPAPQGTVASQLVAQAQPPAPMFDPNMMGLAAPGLEQAAQANQQQMAAGGIVALAGGGPVRGFEIGGETNPWLSGMPKMLDAPDTRAYEQDLARPSPLTNPTTSRTVGAGESSSPSYEERIQQYVDLEGVPPDVAAELIARHDHQNAQRSKMNVFENIASALGGYLGATGSGQRRAGAGIMSMMQSMGQHQKTEDREQELMDAMYAKSRMLPYEQRSKALSTILAQDLAQSKAAREYAQKLRELEEERKTRLLTGEQAGKYDIQKADIGAAAQRYGVDVGATSRENVANIHADAMREVQKLKAAGVTDLSSNNITALAKSLVDMGYNPKQVEQMLPTLVSSARSQFRNAAPTPTTGGGWGNPYQLGNYPAWLSDDNPQD